MPGRKFLKSAVPRMDGGVRTRGAQHLANRRAEPWGPSHTAAPASQPCRKQDGQTSACGLYTQRKKRLGARRRYLPLSSRIGGFLLIGGSKIPPILAGPERTPKSATSRKRDPSAILAMAGCKWKSPNTRFRWTETPPKSALPDFDQSIQVMDARLFTCATVKINLKDEITRVISNRQSSNEVRASKRATPQVRAQARMMISSGSANQSRLGPLSGPS